jgi:hypothetical protein
MSLRVQQFLAPGADETLLLFGTRHESPRCNDARPAGHGCPRCILVKALAFDLTAEQRERAEDIAAGFLIAGRKAAAATEAGATT